MKTFRHDAVPTLRAVIFDVDGVLCDSEPFIGEAAIRMFEERHGIKVKIEDFLPFVGAGENRYLGGVAEKYRFPFDVERDKARTYEIYGETVKGRLEPLPGVHEFIGRCRRRGLKLALATSADEVKMLVNLREIGVPLETFDAVAHGLEVEHKKPSPDIFLMAAKKLGVPAGHCLVVEDAINGVAAAKAAGARCLALLTVFPPEKLTRADWIAPSLAEAPDDVLDW